MEAMTKAGVLKSSSGLKPTSAATTVRVVNDKTQVLDGPYADSKEQLGGFHIIEVADLDAAMRGRRARRVRCTVSLRCARSGKGTLLTRDISERIKSE
jgi:hypothetical protein